jgi:predicted metal-dependent hydrolase
MICIKNLWSKLKIMVLDNYSYKVSYRDIKYPRVELKTGSLVFILPFGYKSEIFLERHKDWIDKKINFIEECLRNAKGKELVERSDDDFKNLICNIVSEVSKDLKVKVNQIYFRKMKTKWASLSPVKNLTVNRLMKYLPEYVIEYIIFHEAAHAIEKRHNNRFWSIIEKRYKNYPEFERELFEYWFKVMERKYIE